MVGKVPSPNWQVPAWAIVMRLAPHFPIAERSVRGLFHRSGEGLDVIHEKLFQWRTLKLR